jgi:hypothetical protein
MNLDIAKKDDYTKVTVVTKVDFSLSIKQWNIFKAQSFQPG